MSRYIPIFGILLLLGGCGLTPQGDAIRDKFIGTIAKAAEGGLENSENFMCELAPVGAVKRRYGATVEKSQAYKTLCNNTPTSDVINK